MNRRALLFALSLFLVLSVIMTWPQARYLRTSVADVGDPLLNAWALSWVAHQAPLAPAGLFDANIFYPERWTLAYSEPMLVPALVSAPLAWLGAGPLLVYNIVYLAALVFSGLGTTLLVFELTGNAAAAILSGIIFAFLPFRFDHYSHLQLQQTMFLPLTMWALHRTMRGGRRADAVRLGLFAAFQMLSCVYFGVFLMPYLAVAGLVLLAAEFRVRTSGPEVALVVNRDYIRRTAVAVLIAAVVYALFVAPVGRAHLQASQVVGERSADEARAGSATLTNYLAAAPSNMLYGRWADVFGSPERHLFPGIIAVLLAAIGLARPWTAAKVAYLVALIFAVDLSLGFNGLSYSLLWNVVTPLRGLRVPARMGLFAGFSLAVLAGYGAARLQQWLPSPAARRAAAVVLGGLVLLESSSVPFGLTIMPTEAPPIYADMMQARGNAPRVALVEFPLGQGPTYMYYSTFHWQDLLNGYSGFFPPSYQELERRTQTFPDSESIDYLRSRSVRFITVHGEMLPADDYRRITAAATTMPGLRLVSKRPWRESEIALYRLLSVDGCDSCDEVSDAGVAGTVASVSVTANRPRVRRGDAIELTYTFTPTTAMAAVKGNYWVMAHFIGADRQARWIDDHQPPTPTSQWRPGQPIRYTRTVFAPDLTAVGPVTLEVGLYAPDTQARLALNGREVDGKAYVATTFDIDAPASYEYPDGWFDHEGAPQDAVHWRWTKQAATFVFPNPKRPTQLYVDADAFARRPGPARVTVTLRGQVIATLDVEPDVRRVHRIELTAEQLGTDDRGTVVLSVDRTYAPAELTNGAVDDPRQMGIRVFNISVSE